MRTSNRNRTADRRAHDARAFAGAMGAALLLGGAVSMMLGTAARAETSTGTTPTTTTSRTTTPAKPTGTTAATPTTTTHGKATTTTVSPTTRTTATTTKPTATPKGATPTTTTPTRTTTTTRPTSTTAAVKPVPTAKSVTPAPGTKTTTPAASSAIVQSSAHLDEQVTYQYNALGRRDPFQSLLSGEYVGSDVGGDAAPDVGGLKVVGIVWGDADQFALVEDARGDSHILRRGDKVMNGVVESLKRDAMIVNLTVDGQSQSVTIPLTRKGEKTNANR